MAQDEQTELELAQTDNVHQVEGRENALGDVFFISRTLHYFKLRRMTMSFDIKVAPKGFIASVFIEIDNCDLTMLAYTLAAQIIDVCRCLDPDVEGWKCDRSTGSSSIDTLRRCEPDMGEHGYANCFIKQVSLLESIARLFAARTLDSGTMHECSHARIIRQALQAFKDWKAKNIKIDQDRNGAIWGTATGYNKWDPLEGLEGYGE